MVDDRVIKIIKALGLEGLLWVPGREIDHGLITALVEQWRPETHTFHMWKSFSGFLLMATL